MLARITAVVDAYEVMNNGRPYKRAMGKDEIVAELKRCAGSQFDPKLVVNISADSSGKWVTTSIFRKPNHTFI